MIEQKYSKTEILPVLIPKAASETFSEHTPAGHVQIGDPYTQKKMHDFLLEAREDQHVAASTAAREAYFVDFAKAMLVEPLFCRLGKDFIDACIAFIGFCDQAMSQPRIFEHLPNKVRATAIADIIEQFAIIDALRFQVIPLNPELLHLFQNIAVGPNRITGAEFNDVIVDRIGQAFTADFIGGFEDRDLLNPAISQHASHG